MRELFVRQKRLQPLGWMVISLVALVFSFVFSRPDSMVHVIACDVGQGDAILITQGESQVLIDGGPNDAVLSCLGSNIAVWDRKIELMVLTNADADHLTGLIEVLKRYEVEKLVTNHLVKDTARFQAFREAVQESGVSVYAPQKGDSIRVGKLYFDVLWPVTKLGDKLVWNEEVSEAVLGANTYSSRKGNEQSVVLQLRYGEFDALFTGDIGESTERDLVDSGSLGDIEVLKVGHHGSKFSSGESFLDALDPELAIISVGRNRYGHPTGEVLGRLKTTGAQILRTDETGDVEIISDGKTFWLGGE